jgi:AraC-like DNA-binding protein
VPPLHRKLLLETPRVTVYDVICDGCPVQEGDEEFVDRTRLVFPYRGTFVRRVGSDSAVAEANQVLFFNAGETHWISHPVPGGDACLVIAVSEPLLSELAPRQLVSNSPSLAFREQRLRIDPRAQILLALLRHSLLLGRCSTREAESAALTLCMRSFGPRTTHPAGSTASKRSLANRAKLVLASDLGRRWTLAEIADEVYASPVYLTQVFQQVEGLPLSRYQRRLRLARALALLPEYDDLTQLGLDLGFSSHSHFTSAFRETFGRTPSEMRSFLDEPAAIKC